MSSGGFVEAFRLLESWGMLDALLPFLLIFTVSFGVLQKAKIFGQDSKKFNVVISFILGMVVVLPHIMGTYPPGSNIVLIINNALPDVGLVLIAIVMVLLLTGIFGFQVDTVGGWVFWAAIIVVGWIFLNAAGWMPERILGTVGTIDPSTLAIVITLLVFGIIISVITSDSDTSVFDKLGGLFKGKKQ